MTYISALNFLRKNPDSLAAKLLQGDPSVYAALRNGKSGMVSTIINHELEQMVNSVPNRVLEIPSAIKYGYSPSSAAIDSVNNLFKQALVNEDARHHKVIDEEVDKLGDFTVSSSTTITPGGRHEDTSLELPHGDFTVTYGKQGTCLYRDGVQVARDVYGPFAKPGDTVKITSRGDKIEVFIASKSVIIYTPLRRDVEFNLVYQMVGRRRYPITPQEVELLEFSIHLFRARHGKTPLRMEHQ